MQKKPSVYNVSNPLLNVDEKTILLKEFAFFQDSVFYEPQIKLQSLDKNPLINNVVVKTRSVQEIEKVSFKTDWITLLLIGLLIIYSFLQKHFNKKFMLIVKSVFSYKYTGLLVRDGSVYREYGFYILLFSSFLSFSMLITSLVGFFDYNIENNYIFFTKILSLLILLYLTKIVFVNFLAKTYRLEKLFSEYVLSHHIFVVFSGVISFILSVVFVYTDYYYVYISVLIVFCFLFLLFLLRLLIIVKSYGFFTGTHFFLYICTVEILPLLVVYKSLKN